MVEVSLVVFSKTRLQIVTVQVESTGETDVWIGLNRLSVTDGHEWLDGSPDAFNNWRQGEPNDALGAESCAELHTGDG